MWADNDSVESGRTAYRGGVEAEPGIGDETDEVGAEHPRSQQISDDHESPRLLVAESSRFFRSGSWRPPGRRPMM